MHISYSLTAALSASLFAVSTPVQAELPLNIEEIITDKGKIKLELSMSYANLESSGLSIGEPFVIQTGPTSFMALPASIGERTTNSDSLIGTTGLRYGLTGNAEIYTRANYLHYRYRSIEADGTKNNSNDTRWVDAWGGINYRLKKDDDTPAIMGFAEIALYEKYNESQSSFKSAMMGFTTYRAIDPVVVSLTASYQFNKERKDGDIDYKPGNLVLLNPSVAFAANDRITLITGMQWINRAADRLNGQDQGMRRTSSDLILGVGYGVAKGNTLNFTFKSNTSGRGGADLRFSWLYTL